MLSNVQTVDMGKDTYYVGCNKTNNAKIIRNISELGHFVFYKTLEETWKRHILQNLE